MSEIVPENALATYQDPDVAVQMSATDYKRLSIEDLALVLRLHGEGRTQREIAAAVGCSQPSVSYALQRLKTSQADITALLKADALDHVKNWKAASAKAAERGDHRPAREAIEAAYPELRPQAASNGGGGGVTINIGTLEPPAINVTPQPLSPQIITAPGEGESKA